MPISVVCPGCKKRFRVSDKYAGQKGPCPQCKGEITIPGAGDEIVIHAPEVEGPTDSTGRKVSAPILREETSVSPKIIAIVGIGVVAVFAMAFVIDDPPWPVLALGAIALGPVLSFGGYTFLRSDELEPYRGTEVWIRSAACGAAYAFLWGAYWWVQWVLEIEFGITALVYVVPALVLPGAFAAFASFDLDYSVGLLHYGFYLIVTGLLCFIMGVSLFATG